jgi:hypothetical protein
MTAIFFILFSLAASGQSWNVVVDNMQFEAAMGKEPVSAMDIYEKIAGSPFLNDTFKDGSLITRDSLLYPEVPLRLNVFKDEMEFLIGHDSAPRVIATPRNFLYFLVGEKTFIFLAFRDGNTPRQGYFEVMNRGESQVLVRRRTDYAGPEGARGFDPATPARFVQKRNTYFVRFGNQVPREIRFRRGSILSAFEKKKDEISGFVRKNGLSYRDPDDLVKIAEYYNQLMEK